MMIDGAMYAVCWGVFLFLICFDSLICKGE